MPAQLARIGWAGIPQRNSRIDLGCAIAGPVSGLEARSSAADGERRKQANRDEQPSPRTFSKTSACAAARIEHTEICSSVNSRDCDLLTATPAARA
ncbi:hypothetical protein [Nannocystis pusilla]|uniref:hypothetical protein n=1 Tax=Nannocystis pusilla TaxID=889268 RepID=UPI003B7FC215